MTELEVMEVVSVPKSKVDGEDSSYTEYVAYMCKLYGWITDALNKNSNPKHSEYVAELTTTAESRIVSAMFDKMCLPYYYWKKKDDNVALLKKAMASQ